MGKKLDKHTVSLDTTRMETALQINDEAIEDLEDIESYSPPTEFNRPKLAAWPQSMVIDIALGLDSTEEILERYGLTSLQWDVLQDNLAFRLDLARTRKEIAETGLSFKRKAATQAEMYLQDMDNIMADRDVAPGVKVDIFKTCAKFGELEPAKAAAEGGVAGAGFNIQINF